MRENCPKCHADLTGEPIPPESQELYGGETHFSRIIGIEIPGKYDGVVAYQCPDCKHTWDRWPDRPSGLV